MGLSPEDRLILWLRQQLPQGGADLLGDDAAFVAGRGPWAITVDHQIEGVHFPAGVSPEVVARRLVAVNLSDVAAIGGRGAYAFLALAAPSGYPRKRFLRALLAALEEHSVQLAGGDLAANQSVSAVLTVIATLPPRRRWVRRSTGEPGDRLWVGVPLGLSAAGRKLLAVGATLSGSSIRLPRGTGLSSKGAAAARRAIHRHLLPQPQLELGSWLARRRRAAAVDISDGLLLDLERLCRASQVGAIVDGSRIPVDRDLGTLADELGVDALDLALTGGEDYVLLFALPAGLRPPRSLACSEIGSLTRGRGVRVRGHRPPSVHGWDHLRASDTHA